MENVIKKITIVTNVGVSQIEVGKDNIVKIIDNTVDEENVYVPIFQCYNDKNILVKEIINCPTDIEYSLMEDIKNELDLED